MSRDTIHERTRIHPSAASPDRRAPGRARHPGSCPTPRGRFPRPRLLRRGAEAHERETHMSRRIVVRLAWVFCALPYIPLNSFILTLLPSHATGARRYSHTVFDPE